MRNLFMTFLTVAGTMLSLFSQAQNVHTKISGNIQDGDKKPIIAATVTLLHARDSSLVKVALSSKTGVYEFENIVPGDYLVMTSAVGFQKNYSQPMNARGTVFILPTIHMQAAVKDLKGVTVTARKPFIEQKIDKMVVNVDAAVSNVGATALEVLEKSPGITIDKDGNISLKGKQGVMVMIDNRPTYLTQAELSNLLKTMPASNLETIEIMTNPSAKYDAAGNSGVINIRTKKNKQKGFNGSLTTTYGQGVYWRNNNSINMNYRTGKVNLFANGGVSFWNGFNEIDILRKYTTPGTKDINAIFEQKMFMRNKEKNFNLKIGADYYLSKKTTLGIVFNGALNPEMNTSEGTSFLKNKNNIVDSIVYAKSDMNTDWNNGSININLRHQFDSTGKELTADIDYLAYRNPSEQLFLNITYHPDWVKKQEELVKGILPVNIDIYSAKLDYTQPLGKKGKIETGFKSSYVSTNNEANYFIHENGIDVPDYSKTNHFLYKENINAAYFNYNRQMNKWGIQSGLRYEGTIAKGQQLGNPERKDSSFTKNYHNLFPTLFVSYEASKNHQFTINYGRRIDRPAYQDMNPFLFFLDRYTYNAGNPYIKPQYAHNVELGHTFKGFLSTTLNYSYTKDLIAETFEQFGYATILRKDNIGKRHNAGIAVSAQMPVKKWWTAIVYTNYNYTSYQGFLYGEPIDISAGNLLVNINNQFKFEKGWSAELSGWYRTKGIEGQIQIDPMGQLAAGVSKQVMKGKGSLKLNVRDVLYTQKVKGKIDFQNTAASFRQIRDSRVASVSFTYRFGKPLKDTPPKRKIGGADEEQNRVKTGGSN